MTKTQELAKIGNWQVDLRTNEFQCSYEARQLLRLDQTNARITQDDFFTSVVQEDRIRVKESLGLALKQNKSINLEYKITIQMALRCQY